MIIGGLEKLTLIDYPGKLSAIVFTQGCNFRCRYCYNPMLVLPSSDGKCYHNPGEEEKGQNQLSEDGLFDFLKKRQGKLEGVVITGGEPTLHPDLPEFIKKVKDLGYTVKLDTNGSNPDMLRYVLQKKLVNYLAMDIKSDEDNYKRTVGADIDFKKIEKSAKIIIGSGLPHEFRTTCVPGFHDQEVIANMSEIIRGAQKWFLQNFKSDTELIEKSLKGQPPFSDKQMKELADIGSKNIKICQVRE